MKRLILGIFFLSFCVLPHFLQAQTQYKETPKYEKYPEIPPFSFTAVGHKTFTNKNLQKDRPVMIFLFSVDCSHCQHETQEIIKNIDKFKNSQILMITPHPYDRMYAYYRGFGVNKYPNIITMGTDPTRALNIFYEQQYFPGIYIYDKKGELVYHEEGDISVDTLAQYMK